MKKKFMCEIEFLKLIPVGKSFQSKMMLCRVSSKFSPSPQELAWMCVKLGKLGVLSVKPARGASNQYLLTRKSLNLALKEIESLGGFAEFEKSRLAKGPVQAVKTKGDELYALVMNA